MNAGHYKEVITTHNSDWNWKKFIELGMPLWCHLHQQAYEILAKCLLMELDMAFVQVHCKHTLFHGLKAVHHEYAAQWSALDWVATKNAKSHKLEKSIYHHNTKLKGKHPWVCLSLLADVYHKFWSKKLSSSSCSCMKSKNISEPQLTWKIF